MIRSVLWVLILLSVLFSAAHGHDGHQSAEHPVIASAAQGDYQTAKDELVRELDTDPFNDRAQSSLEIIEDVLSKKTAPETTLLMLKGIKFYYEGNHEIAISLFSKAILSKSDYAAAYMNRGRSYALAGQHRLAVRDYNRAIELSPEYTKAYISRGIAYAQKSEYDHAVSDYDKAEKIDTGNPDVYYNRAVAYTKKGMYDKAILDYDRTIVINPKHANAYTNRGIIYRVFSEDKVKACADWKQACKLGSCNNYSLAQRDGYCE